MIDRRFLIMKKNRKVALIVLASISAFMLVAFTVLFFLLPTFLGPEAELTVASEFAAIGAMFKYPFVAGAGAEGGYLAMSILCLVVSGIVLVSLVLGIVVACLKKRPVYLVFIPVLLLAELAALALFTFSTFPFVPMLKSGIGGYVVLGIVYFLTAILGFVLAYVTYILALCWAGDRRGSRPIAIASVAEEASDPEYVEEGQELSAPVMEEPAVVAIPVEEPEAPQAVEEEPKVEPEPVPEKTDGNQVNVNVNNGAGGLDQNSLAALLREVVRDIVRDEIARNNANQPEKAQQAPAGNQTITGATFGGPLVVQYFNGGINGVTPAAAPAPAVVEAPKAEPAPVVEEPAKEEPKPEPEPVKEEPAPAPVVEVKPEPVPLFTKKPEEPGKPEAPKYERITFAERLLKSDKELHDLYNELKNEILSYGVKSRISAVGDTFRLHKKMYVRITVAGKSLKLYFALDPKDYEGTTIPVQDASNKEMYAEIPLVFKVKSGLSVRRCKELIQTVMEKDNLEQGEVGKVNWIKELKAEMAADKKKEKEEE